MSESKLAHILNLHPIAATDVIRGNNTTLLTKTNQEIIDFEAGMWCTALGHNHPRISAVIAEQASKVINLHYKLTSVIAESLAQNLLDLLNFDDGKAVFLSSGSEAVELSMRLSQLISPGKMVTFAASYLSAYSSTSNPRSAQQWTQIDHLRCAGCSQANCSRSCPILTDVDFSSISAFLFEPGNSGGRVLLPPKQLVQYVADEVKGCGGLLIANEVTTGLGRTGKWFGYQYYDLTPDIVAMGKALGNGYPISAVAMKPEVAEKVEAAGFVYAQSHQNDPLGCAVAHEVLRVLKEEKLIDRSQEVGIFFLEQLLELQKICPVIKEARGRGLMLTLELDADGLTETIAEELLEQGYFIGTAPAANVLRFYPALTVAKEDIVGLCRVLGQVLTSGCV